MLHPPDWALLSDDDVVRELQHAYDKRRDVLDTGALEALLNHSKRVTALEGEYVRRFADRVADAEAKLGYFTKALEAEPAGDAATA
jgi:hypothetical protein